MFGLFKKKKLLDEIAECIRSQLKLVLDERETLFDDDNPKESIFFNIYLSNMIEYIVQLRVDEFFETKDHREDKYILDKLNTDLWFQFCNTQALIKLIEEDHEDKLKSSFSIISLRYDAESASDYDSYELVKDKNALNLYKYLTGKKLSKR